MGRHNTALPQSEEIRALEVRLSLSMYLAHHFANRTLTSHSFNSGKPSRQPRTSQT